MTKLAGAFILKASVDFPMTLTIEMPDDEVESLTAKAREQGLSPEQYARQVLAQEVKSGGRRHISKVIRDNMRDVPRKILDELPPDGASQHDHYIYGTPKTDQ